MENKISNSQMMEMFTLNYSSELPFEQISQKFESECAKYNFSLLHTYDYNEILENKGFPIQSKVKIFEICQAKVASKILINNPHFSVFMPCRISLFEAGNKTILSTMNMGLMLEMIKENQELYDEANDLFNSLKKLIESLTK